MRKSLLFALAFVLGGVAVACWYEGRTRTAAAPKAGPLPPVANGVIIRPAAGEGAGVRLRVHHVTAGTKSEKLSEPIDPDHIWTIWMPEGDVVISGCAVPGP